MGRINNISTLIQGLKTVPDLSRFIASALDSILTQLNGKLTFGENIQSFGPVSVTFTDTQPLKIAHGLGRTPSGVVITGMDRAAILFYPNKTTFPWTDTQIFLQSDTASLVADILIF
jgi:hypothetical protein